LVDKPWLARLQRNKRTLNLNDNPDITMIKHILLLAVAIGFHRSVQRFRRESDPYPEPGEGSGYGERIPREENAS
jgi:hypothetical protein